VISIVFEKGETKSAIYDFGSPGVWWPRSEAHRSPPKFDTSIQSPSYNYSVSCSWLQRSDLQQRPDLQ